MDFFRPRAIPALIALAASLPLAAAECSFVEGTYQYESRGKKGETDTFSRLVLHHQGDAQKLYRRDGGSAPGGLGAGELKSRPRSVSLAKHVRVSGSQKGFNVEFFDAKDTKLVEALLDSGGKWTCSGSKLERSMEQMTGIGNDIVTEKRLETLKRDGDALVFTETRAVIDPPTGKTRSSEMRFPAAR